MARIAHCDFKDGGCDDGRCKIDSCVMDNLERAKSGVPAPPAVAEGWEQSNLVRELSRIRRQTSKIKARIEKLERSGRRRP